MDSSATIVIPSFMRVLNVKLIFHDGSAYETYASIDDAIKTWSYIRLLTMYMASNSVQSNLICSMRGKVLVAWIDQAVFCSAIFLVVVGLIFEASGFGIIVVGRLDGVILIVMGFAMFWGGWVMSGARGFSCATAAVLNMFDAASTISFWSFEINPLVRVAGPTILLMAKVVCSITIVLYAKFHHDPWKGGVMLTLFFSLIVGWNLGQHALAYLGLRFLPHRIYIYIIGAALSFAVSAIVLSLLFLRETSKRSSK